LKSLSEFCGLDATQNEIEKVASQANKNRAYAYLKDPELKAFSLDVSDRLKSYCY